MNHKNGLFKVSALLVIMLISLKVTFGQPAAKKALMVIDVQENFLNPESKIHINTPHAGSFLSSLNLSVSKFYKNNDLILYVVNEWTNPVMNWATGNVSKKSGSGVGLDKRLLVVNENIFSKSKSNSLTNKDVLKILRDNEISEVYVAGLLAEGCVKATVKGLIKEKFNVVVIEDALGSKNEANKLKVTEFFQGENIEIINSDKL
ncbi:MAG: cysteine hydrolase [Spirochaetes bacterium]|nr:cysteine hydrolase [Spirochaetota bacterium]